MKMPRLQTALLLTATVAVSAFCVWWTLDGRNDGSVHAEARSEQLRENQPVNARPMWAGESSAAARTHGNDQFEPDATRERAAIPNELVISITDGVAIEQIAQHYGAEIVGRMDRVGAYRLRFTDPEAAKLARQRMKGDSGVARIESNFRVTPPPPVSLTGTEANALLTNRDLQAVDADSPIVIGLIDTEINSRVAGADGFLLTDNVTMAQFAQDGGPSHGSAVLAAMMGGMANVLGESATSSVKVLPVDVYGDHALTSSYQVAEGVADAIEKGATVINLSLGSDAQSALLEEVIAVGDDLGVVFVGAAGNEPVTTETYPAAYPPVVAVTSLTAEGAYADYANRGEFIDVGAPGLVRFGAGEAEYLSAGTSMAAGVVSGMIAALAEKEGITVDEASARIADQLAVEAAQ